MIGCDCEVCKSSSPFNKRLRPSVLLKIGDTRLLIDAGPDFRSQALTHNIRKIDGVLFTHTHHDHTAGIDDLRVYYFLQNKTLPCLVSKESAEDLEKRYDFMFRTQPHEKKTPRLELITLPDNRGTFEFQGIKLRYMSYIQMNMKVTGFRFGDLAYLTDMRDYSDSLFEDLKGIKTLVISALRFTPSHMHLSVDEACEFAKRTTAEKVYFTHISHDLDYFKGNSYLPEHIRLAYDGLEIPF